MNRVLKTMNSELDRRLGGGLVLPTLALIEGPNDSGKSVLCYQFCYGALHNGFRVCFVTTEHSVRGLINAMESLNFNVREFFLNGSLRIIELHVEGLKWTPELSRRYLTVLLNYVKHKANKIDIFFIDSLTHIVTHATREDVLNFFTSALNLATQGTSIFITLHDYAVDQDLMIRIRAICDTHIMLSVRESGGRVTRLMKIMKAKGLEKVSDEVICFEVHPAFGIKIVPFTQAKM